MKFIRQHWLIILILISALFLRVYNIAGTMTFLEDEGRDMLIVKRMIDTRRPVLIGPQTSTGNMYLGPMYYYLITPALLLAHMNPIGPAIFIALTGVATVWLIYLLADKWFGRTPALISSAFYAILPMVILFTRNSWNPNLVPFTVVLILWVLDFLVVRPQLAQKKHWFYLGLLIGLLVQLHYMALVFVGFVGLLLLFSYRKQGGHLLSQLVYALIGFLLILSPFIVFEFRNHFVNTLAIKKLLLATDEHTLRYALPFWLYRSKVTSTAMTLFGNLFSRSFFTSDPLKSSFTIIFVILSTFIAFNLKQTSSKRATLVLLFLLFAPLLSLGVYQESIHPHYLSFLFPLTPLVLASGITTKQTRWLTIIFIIFTSLYLLPQTFSYINSGPTLQLARAKSIADYINQTIGNKPYNLVSNATTNTTPYQYFTYLLDNPPRQTQAEDVFLICQDKPCQDSDIENKQLFTTGSAHPTLTNYTGHPLATYVTEDRKVITNQHVDMGVWVVHLQLVPVQ